MNNRPLQQLVGTENQMNSATRFAKTAWSVVKVCALVSVSVVGILYCFDSDIKANTKAVEKNEIRIQNLEKISDKTDKALRVIDTKIDNIINILLGRKR